MLAMLIMSFCSGFNCTHLPLSVHGYTQSAPGTTLPITGS
jgi:hypothetical protein